MFIGILSDNSVRSKCDLTLDQIELERCTSTLSLLLLGPMDTQSFSALLAPPTAHLKSIKL